MVAERVMGVEGHSKDFGSFVEWKLGVVDEYFWMVRGLMGVGGEEGCATFWYGEMEVVFF